MDKKGNVVGETETKEQNLFQLASKEIEEEQEFNSFSDVVDEVKEENKESNVSFDNLLHIAEENDDENTSKIIDNNNYEESEIDDNKEIDPNENLETINPFITIDEEPTELIIPSKEEDTDISNKSPFIKEENPFVKDDDTIIESPFVKDDDTIIESPFVKEEPLAETPITKETETQASINNLITEENKPEEQNMTNPFFADTTFKEENQLEENPFFQNGITLNEKQKHQNNEKLDFSDAPHYNVKIEKQKPKKIKVVLGVLSYAVFIWLLLIGITLLVYVANIKIKQMKGDYTPPKYNAYVVLTGSMLPSIKVEDVVVTKKIDAKDLEEGDIITFASSDERYYGTIITHRIKKKYYDSTTGKYTFQSQGDNNNVADSALVEEDNIYGKVILRIPKLGYLQVFLASKGGWIIVILIPCAVVVSFDIVKLFKMMSQKRKLKIEK